MSSTAGDVSPFGIPDGVDGPPALIELPDQDARPLRVRRVVFGDNCGLVRQFDQGGRPIHAVWGIPKGETAPAVLITAYRPDPTRWTDDFLRRRP